jgi:hypothetical protein
MIAKMNVQIILSLSSKKDQEGSRGIKRNPEESRRNQEPSTRIKKDQEGIKRNQEGTPPKVKPNLHNKTE